MPVTPPPRALRAAMASAVAVAVAVTAHRTGDGAVDGAGAAWAFAGLAGPAWWLAGRERGWGALVLTQLVGQQIAHFALTVASGHPMLDGPGAMLPMDLMLYAHLAAAALTGAWLRVGERRAWAAARRLRRIVVLAMAHLLDAGPEPVAPVPLRPTPPAAQPRAELLRHTLARRGPPLAT